MKGEFIISAGKKIIEKLYCNFCEKETNTIRLDKIAYCKDCKNIKGIFAGEEDDT